MLRLLRVADAAGFVIASNVNRATDDAKSFRDLYDDVSAEFELDRPLLSVKLMQLVTTPVTDFTAPSSIDQTLAKSKQDGRAFGIPEPHTIHFVAGTQLVHAPQISLPRTQILNGPRHSSIRNDYISLKLAASKYIGAKCGPTDLRCCCASSGSWRWLRAQRTAASAYWAAESHRTDLLVCQSQAHLTCGTAGLSALHAANNVLSSLTTPIETVVITCKLLLGHELIDSCTSHLRCAPLAHLV